MLRRRRRINGHQSTHLQLHAWLVVHLHLPLHVGAYIVPYVGPAYFINECVSLNAIVDVRLRREMIFLISRKLLEFRASDFQDLPQGSPR